MSENAKIRNSNSNSSAVGNAPCYFFDYTNVLLNVDEKKRYLLCWKRWKWSIIQNLASRWSNETTSSSSFENIAHELCLRKRFCFWAIHPSRGWWYFVVGASETLESNDHLCIFIDFLKKKFSQSPKIYSKSPVWGELRLILFPYPNYIYTLSTKTVITWVHAQGFHPGPKAKHFSAKCPRNVRWRTFGGQVRTGTDNSGSWVSLGSRTFNGHMADTWRTLDGHLADTCFTFGPKGFSLYS